MDRTLVNPFAWGSVDRRAFVRSPPLLLAVDALPANTASVQTIFGRDHQVLMLHSGEEALEFCHGQLPDLILLGLQLPGLKGREVCRQLKSHPLTRYVPVIFLADRSDADEEAHALKDGAVDFIVRPVGTAVMRERIKTHLMLRRATKQILAFNETLTQRVAERTGELEATMETLYEFHSKLVDSEARATLSTVVANVSHELSTPISNSMLTANTLVAQTQAFHDLVDSGQLKRSELGVFLTVLREGTDLMERNLHRANVLLGNFKQVAIDQVNEERREFDLALTIQEIITSVMPSIKNRPHRIVMEVPAGITLNSLPGRLGQVVINLINNAFLHAFEGRDAGILTISAERDADHVQLCFSDNGVGMSEDTLGRLFQPFFTTKKGKGGNGLGMPIVDNLVRMSLGGSIRVSSTLGEGSAFLIRLPQTVEMLP